eukprot:387731-Rhodomonas_salina.1
MEHAKLLKRDATASLPNADSDTSTGKQATPSSQAEGDSASKHAESVHAAAPKPDQSAGAVPKPDQSAGAAPKPDQSAGAVPKPDQSAGAVPKPDQSAGAAEGEAGRAAKKKERGAAKGETGRAAGKDPTRRGGTRQGGGDQGDDSSAAGRAAGKDPTRRGGTQQGGAAGSTAHQEQNESEGKIVDAQASWNGGWVSVKQYIHELSTALQHITARRRSALTMELFV